MGNRTWTSSFFFSTYETTHPQCIMDKMFKIIFFKSLSISLSAYNRPFLLTQWHHHPTVCIIERKLNNNWSINYSSMLETEISLWAAASQQQKCTRAGKKWIHQKKSLMSILCALLLYTSSWGRKNLNKHCNALKIFRNFNFEKIFFEPFF